MKIDQIIEELQKIKDIYGNLDCVIEVGEWDWRDLNILVVGELNVDSRSFIMNGEIVRLPSVLFMV